MNLTPTQIVAELNRYIVGQDEAKRAVAVALRNRWRRLQLPKADQADVVPKNILMMGPTGVGKTEIARRLAQLVAAPFIKVEATKFTEVGYVGRDVESMIRDLVSQSINLVRAEQSEKHLTKAAETVEEELVGMVTDQLAPLLVNFSIPGIPGINPSSWNVPEAMAASLGVNEIELEGEDAEANRVAENALNEKRRQIRVDFDRGEYEEFEIEVPVEEENNPFFQVFSAAGIEEMGVDGSQLGGLGSRTILRRLPVKEAREVLLERELKTLTDEGYIKREALRRAESMGIIFIDEIDKVCGGGGGSGPDVSREGVQRDLLPIIEGSAVQTKFGTIQTDHILFIAAGAFHLSKPSDLIPELQGRLPIRVQLDPLSESDFRSILVQPKNSLVRQYQALLASDGVNLVFDEGALSILAEYAFEQNERGPNIGARRLFPVFEQLLHHELFSAPHPALKEVVISEATVRQRLALSDKK